MLELTSVQNPRVKHALGLRERRARDEEELFLIEGYRELRRAVDHGVVIEEFFFCRDLFLGENEEALIEDIERRGAKLYSCNKAVFTKLSYRDRPDGLVAVAVQMKRELGSLSLSSSPFFLIAEAIEKPGNLGTMLRSADAAGVDGVIVCDRCTDIYNPNVVRSSVGTLFTVPVVEASTQETLAWLDKHEIAIVAATPHADAEFTETNLRGPLAIAVGTEQLGLSKTWMDAAAIRVKIPMHGVADSLNVSAATTLMLYEVERQRKHAATLLR